jgi:hypothetical protein
MSQETEYKNNLNRERSGRNSGAMNPKNSLNKIAKNVATSISIIGLLEITDIFFLVAIMAAMAKDILDCLVIPAFPVIGTALTLMASFTIMAAMFICGASSTHRSKMENLVGKAVKKWGVLAAGTCFEFFFGLNFIPTETVTAVIIFVFILQERKVSREEQKKEEEENAQMAGAYA